MSLNLTLVWSTSRLMHLMSRYCYKTPSSFWLSKTFRHLSDSFRFSARHRPGEMFLIFFILLECISCLVIAARHRLLFGSARHSDTCRILSAFQQDTDLAKRSPFSFCLNASHFSLLLQDTVFFLAQQDIQTHLSDSFRFSARRRPGEMFSIFFLLECIPFLVIAARHRLLFGLARHSDTCRILSAFQQDTDLSNFFPLFSKIQTWSKPCSGFSLNIHETPKPFLAVPQQRAELSNFFFPSFSKTQTHVEAFFAIFIKTHHGRRFFFLQQDFTQLSIFSARRRTIMFRMWYRFVWVGAFFCKTDFVSGRVAFREEPAFQERSCTPLWSTTMKYFFPSFLIFVKITKHAPGFFLALREVAKQGNNGLLSICTHILYWSKPILFCSQSWTWRSQDDHSEWPVRTVSFRILLVSTVEPVVITEGHCDSVIPCWVIPYCWLFLSRPLRV